MMRAFYSALLTLAIPVILLRLWWRGRREPGYRCHIAERFALTNRDLPRAAVWIHAVSVGEVRAALPLVTAVRAAFPHRPIVLTCMTPAGRRAAVDLLPEGTTVRYLPYDLPGAMRRFVSVLAPAILLVMETEIWPNLLATCRRAQVPCYLVNARLSEKSWRGYRRFPPVRALIGAALRDFAGVLAQSDDDAARLVALGATAPTVTGNLKFDIALAADLIDRGRQWHIHAGTRAVLLFAITREEEEMLLAHALLRAVPDRTARPLLVVVPRHPTRFADVYRQLERLGLTVMRRSQTVPSADTDVWLGDSMGEMQAYFAMADIAIVGGSFARLGGQNFIDAAALGTPVVVGPHTFNFAEAVRLAHAANALVIATDADTAVREALALLNDDVRRHAMAGQARQFAASHRGATARTMAAIADALHPVPTTFQ